MPLTRDTRHPGHTAPTPRLVVGLDVGGSAVKAAVLIDGEPRATAASETYTDPSPEELAQALRAACTRAIRSLGHAPPDEPLPVGVAVPGLLTEDGSAIAYAANLPRLQGVDLRDAVAAAIGDRAAIAVITSDTTANALGYHHRHPTAGRLLAIAIGTGLGAAVLDDGFPLAVTSAGPGHLGHIDLGPVLPGDDPARPRTPETVLGAAALRARLGNDPEALHRAPDDDPAFIAISRLIRTAHAIYRPHTVALLGGVGVLFAGVLTRIDAIVRRELTPLARSGWTLRAAASADLGAEGAARLALRSLERRPPPSTDA